MYAGAASLHAQPGQTPAQVWEAFHAGLDRKHGHRFKKILDYTNSCVPYPCRLQPRCLLVLDFDSAAATRADTT